MQFYMGNPISLGKFHPKNKNPREPVAQEGPPSHQPTNQSQPDFHERNMNLKKNKYLEKKP